MTRLLTSALVALSLLAAAPPASAKSPQLVRSVQLDLKLWGFRDVSAEELTNHQLTELYLLFNDAPPRFGMRAALFQNRVRTVLRKSG